MTQGESNEWHADCAWLNSQPYISWARIIYLTDGSPINFGKWDFSCSSGTAPGPHGGYPIPPRVELSIDIYPNLCLEFPAFYLHSNPTHTKETARWAIVNFYDSLDRKQTLELYNDYFRKSSLTT